MTKKLPSTIINDVWFLVKFQITTSYLLWSQILQHTL